MAGNGNAGPAQAGAEGITQAQVGAVLDALDRAFADVVHARYGGGIQSVFLRGARVQEQTLRADPPGIPGHLLLELHLLTQGEGGAASSPTGFGQLFHGLSTVIGTLDMTGGPDQRAAHVKVVTEVFDDQDGGDRVADATIHHGILLKEAPPYLSGSMGAHSITVARSQGALSEGAKAGRQSQRGWMAHPERMRSNRGGGLGSNGHRRAPPVGLAVPVATRLLRRIGDRLVEHGEIGAALHRVVVGLENGDAA